MNRPTWVATVAVLAIIFGCLGILNSANTAALPQMLKLQRTFIQSVVTNMPAQKGGPNGQDMAKAFDSFIGPIPAWFAVWCVIAGLAGMALSTAYLYAAISLLQLKRSALQLFYRCTAGAIALAVTRGVLGALGARLMGLNILFSSFASIAFHIVLLLVVTTSDKAAFVPALSSGADPAPSTAP
jgi:hypothetical protein